MNLLFYPRAWNEFCDSDYRELIVERIEETLRRPFKGLHKPEPLVHDPHKRWSRRITQEHRLIYRVIGVPKPKANQQEQRLEIYSCKGHY